MLNNMQGNDVMTIVITFIIGFVGGFYFFLTGYAPYAESIKQQFNTDKQSEASSLVVVAKQYGGCEQTRQCASFQIDYDGTYRYLPYSVLQGAVPEQGVLPRSIQNEVKKLANQTKLDNASRMKRGENCISYVDGIDYNYEILFAGQVYVLDTCRTNLSEYPEIVETFNRVWVYLGG